MMETRTRVKYFFKIRVSSVQRKLMLGSEVENMCNQYWIKYCPQGVKFTKALKFRMQF